jgi:hypothetical protein
MLTIVLGAAAPLELEPALELEPELELEVVAALAPELELLPCSPPLDEVPLPELEPPELELPDPGAVAAWAILIVASAAAPRLAPEVLEVRRTLNCLPAPAELIGTRIVFGDLSPMSQLSVPFCAA